jgi:hypothetical protein
MKKLAYILISLIPFITLAGEFNLLTYNVAGLPTIISKANGQNGERNNPLISPRLNDFDIVLVQEDFAYHKLLVEDVLHPFISKFKKKGFFRLGDGLNTFSKFPINGYARKTWAKCNGIFQGKSGSDCLTPKGFTIATFEIKPGLFIDIYNLHGEAGDLEKDDRAREINFKQLINFIEEQSFGRAVILAGDFNLHQENPKDAQKLDKILSTLKFKDTCKEVDCSEPTHIDRIFYRSGLNIDLSVIEWVNRSEDFKDDEGKDLSDHPPISARFNWEVREDALRLISLKALHSGLCLGRGNDNKAAQVDCKDRLDLAVIEALDKSVTLMDFDSKLCLEVENGKKNNRRDLTFRPCHFNSQQRFSIGDLDSTNPMSLRAKNSGKCVDVYGEDKNAGARVIQYKCHGGDNQLWDVII